MADLPRAPRRLLLLVTSLGCGGAERTVYDLAARLDRERWLPEVLALQPLEPPNDFFAGPLRARGIPVGSLDLRGVAGVPLALFRLARRLRRGRFALLHAQLFHAGLLGRLAARLAGGPPVVATIQIAEARAVPWRFRLDRWLRRLVAAETCVSAAVADFHARATGASRAALRVIPNAVDLARFAPDPVARAAVRAELGLDATALVVGTVGRLDPQKDQALLLEAFARVAATRPAARLVLVGEGPERARLAERAAAADLAGRVVFTGRRTDVERLLAAFDVFAFSSRYEGLPLALLEALAAGRPVVSVAFGAEREALLDEATGEPCGLIVPREAAALAEAIGALLDDPARAAALGAAGRRRVAALFSAERMVERYTELYEELLGGV